MFSRRSYVSTLLLCSGLFGQAPDEAERIRSVESVGRLWGSIQQYHPKLTSNSSGWEEAFAKAAEKIWTATSNEIRISALDGLLATLKDPATRRVQPRGKSQVELSGTVKPFTWLEGNVLLVHLNDPLRLWDRPENARAVILPEIEKAGVVIFDLRPLKQDRREQGLGGATSILDMLFESILTDLVDKPLHLPGERSRLSMGTPPPDAQASSEYCAGVFIRQGQLIKPKTVKARPMVFLVNDESYIPSCVLAFQHHGWARLITEGNPSIDWSAKVEEATLFENIKAEYRISELVFSDGTSGAVADDQVQASIHTDLRAPAVLKGVEVSKKLAFSPRRIEQFGALVPETSAAEKDVGPQYPDLGHRLLAAVKFWNAVNGFFAYSHLLDKPWGEVLHDHLASFANAKNALEYQQAVARMVVCIQDSHGTLTKAYPDEAPLEIERYLGEAALPVVVQVIEGKVAVTTIGDPALERAGLKVGDAVLAVDGEGISERMSRIRPFTAASTPHRLEYRVANRAMYGPKGKEAILLVQGVTGKPREVRFNRQASQSGRFSRRSGEVFKVLPGNIGYLDLDRIKPMDVDRAYDQLKNTRAMIFDMRGYPVVGAWMVPSRFVASPNKVAATFRVPMVMVRDGQASVSWMEESQKTSTIGNAPYIGKVVMLMDEGSQSSAEHMGLHLEAGNNATFVGSPTSGANGNVTYVFLPGNLKTYFTGLDTRHGNGDQLQRKGLQPHIVVRPTTQGLSEGRDEVLERGIKFINEGH